MGYFTWPVLNRGTDYVLHVPTVFCIRAYIHASANNCKLQQKEKGED